MTRKNWSFASLGVALMLLGPIAAGESSRIWRTSHTLKNDDRVVKDRLHARNNRDHEDYSFLNAVGAVWPDCGHCQGLPTQLAQRVGDVASATAELAAQGRHEE